MVKKLQFAMVVVVLSMILGATAVVAGPREPSSLRFFEDNSSAGGVSLLTRDGDAGQVSVKINATHLMRGAAYTYWWVVFNHPENCSPPACGEDDIFLNGDPMQGLDADQINAVEIAVLGGNGQVVNRGGRATFTGVLKEGEVGDHDVVLGPGGIFDFPWLLDDATSAEIHIITKNHGPALSGDALEAQLTTFAGNCIGLDPNGTFECVEDQYAIHLP